MRWTIYIKMFGPNWKEPESWWAVCCVVWSVEMVGIVERALQASGQEVKVVRE